MTETPDLIGSIENALPLARRIAAKWAESYPPVEAGDVYGDLSLWLVENGSRVVGKSVGYAVTCLKRRATVYARQERAARLHQDDQEFYWPYDVRRALSELHAELTTIPQVVERVDLHAALGKLTARQQEVLLAWADAPTTESGAVDWETLAAELGSATANAAMKRVANARRELQRHMNGQARDHEGPGARKAMSNAKARWVTANSYGGEHAA